MEGKVKEKLESVGLALFCLSLKYHNPMDSWGAYFVTLSYLEVAAVNDVQ